MNELITVTTDESGQQLTSGRELHEFLGIDTPYRKWFPRMCEYGFIEGVDYTPDFFVHPLNNQEITDHALTIDMAKEVSMIQRNEKGKQARQYFIEVEKRHKQQQIDTSHLSPELQMVQGLFTALANQELATKQLETKVDSISEIVALNSTDWRKDSRNLVNKIAKAQGGYGAYQEIQTEIYQELERRANCRLSIRLTNMRNTAAGNGVCKSKRDKMNKLDVIADEKRLLEVYLAVVKEYAIKYGVWKD